MKRRTKEYNYDWMEKSTFGIGATLFNGTPKEIAATIGLVPTFAPVLQTIVKSGEVGRLFCLVADDYMDRMMHAHERGKKLVLTTFLASNLLFDCFDGIEHCMAEPVTGYASLAFRQCNYEYFDYGCEVGLTETSCSAQRGSVGAFLAGLMASGKPDLCVVGSEGPCDTNCNSMQFYADYAKIPLITLDTPPTLVDGRVEDFQLRDLENMIEQVEKLTGAHFNEDKLRELLTENKKQTVMLGEICEMCRLIPNPVSAINLLFSIAAHITHSGTKLYTSLLEEVLRLAKLNAKAGRAGTYSGKEKTRLFMCYIDHFTTDAQFYEWAMSNDISLLVNMVFAFWAEGAPYGSGLEDECYTTDTSSRESMLRTLAAANAHMPMNKQLRGPWNAKGQWLSDTKGLAKLTNPDYINYAGTLGCRNSWSVNKLIQREMENLGYPCMITFADVFDERPKSWEQVKREMEEFMAVRAPGRRAA